MGMTSARTKIGTGASESTEWERGFRQKKVDQKSFFKEHARGRKGG